jgi:dihydrofolate synthase/folylpolyglutamate synthase
VLFPEIARLAALKPSRMNLSLENVSTLFERLGHPEHRFPSVLVAGTNGKGSVTTYVSSVLGAMGFRVGAYYSPHIHRLHERIRLDGEEISSYDLNELIGEVRARARGVPMTYFECLTAVAARFFVEERVEIAVLEVGLGGRLDATNVAWAISTAVTGISRDHREHLGRTKGAILSEKLGIVRSGVPCIVNLASRRLREQAKRRCETLGAPFHSVQDEASAAIVALCPDSMRVRLVTPRRDYGTLSTAMIGVAQAENIATAARIVETLEDSGFRTRDGVDAVRRGVARAFLAGRFQVVSRAPLVVLDVSHNEESLAACLDTLRRISDPRRIVIVFGVLAHKELGSFPARALASSRRIVVTRLRDKGSASEEHLRRVFEAARRDGRGASIAVARGVAEAIGEAKRTIGPADTLAIMGSHRTVAEAAPYL